MELSELVADIALAIPAIDAGLEAAKGERYIASVGTISEDSLRDQVLRELIARRPEKYSSARVDVSYPSIKGARCDLVIGAAPAEWAVELKKVGFVGDNGKNNDFGPAKVVSPYRIHRSSMLDAERLQRDKPASRGAVLMYGFDFYQAQVEKSLIREERPERLERVRNLQAVLRRNGGDYLVELTFRMFELMSQETPFSLGKRFMGTFSGLSAHPIYSCGKIAAWEVQDRGCPAPNSLALSPRQQSAPPRGLSR